MKERGFWGTFARIAGITALPSVLLFSWSLSLIWDLKFSQVFVRYGIWSGIGFGLLFGLIMAFSMKAVTISVTFEDKETFLSRINITLAEMGYHPESQNESFLTYKPSFQAGILAGKISVSIKNSIATIVGPNSYIKKLQKLIQ